MKLFLMDKNKLQAKSVALSQSQKAMSTFKSSLFTAFKEKFKIVIGKSEGMNMSFLAFSSVIKVFFFDNYTHTDDDLDFHRAIPDLLTELLQNEDGFKNTSGIQFTLFLKNSKDVRNHVDPRWDQQNRVGSSEFLQNEHVVKSSKIVQYLTDKFNLVFEPKKEEKLKVWDRPVEKLDKSDKTDLSVIFPQIIGELIFPTHTRPITITDIRNMRIQVEKIESVRHQKWDQILQSEDKKFYSTYQNGSRGIKLKIRIKKSLQEAEVLCSELQYLSCTNLEDAYILLFNKMNLDVGMSPFQFFDCCQKEAMYKKANIHKYEKTKQIDIDPKDLEINVSLYITKFEEMDFNEYLDFFKTSADKSIQELQSQMDELEIFDKIIFSSF